MYEWNFLASIQHLLGEKPMFRTVVVRILAASTINVNDEIGLEPYANYTLAEHLEDLAGDGLELLVASGEVHVFSDDSVQFLVQRTERIAADRTDPETWDQMLSSAASIAASTQCAATALVA